MINVLSRLIFLLIFILFSINLNSQNQDKPISLEECYVLITSYLASEEIYEIIKSDTPDIMLKYHFTLGMYIRNYWIRDGNRSLVKQINYKNRKIDADDLGGIILRGYWYHVHNQVYKWEYELEYAEQANNEPDPRLNPEHKKLEGLVSPFFYYERKTPIPVYFYRISESKSYYMYIGTKGWRKLSIKQFQDLLEIYNIYIRDKLIDDLYKK
jgi:hypothetical protein